MMVTSMAAAETLPMSNDRLLTEQDIMGMDANELKVARNEIFARHGYSFNSIDLRNHFAQYDWYTPKDKSVSLSSIEQDNVAFIKKYESDPILRERLTVSAGGGAPQGVFVVPVVPVMIRREDNLDPCSVGIVKFSNSDRNYVAVRSGPGENYEEIDRLYIGDQVSLCDASDAWRGVVYTPKGIDTCTWADIDFTYMYQGTCSSGWILKDAIGAVAG